MARSEFIKKLDKTGMTVDWGLQLLKDIAESKEHQTENLEVVVDIINNTLGVHGFSMNDPIKSSGKELPEQTGALEDHEGPLKLESDDEH